MSNRRAHQERRRAQRKRERTPAAERGSSKRSDVGSPTLKEIASTLRALVATVDETRDRAGTEFAPDSPAVSDWTANEMPGAWGVQLLQDGYLTGVMLGFSARDHLLALADAIESGRPFAAVTLARAVAESSARAWFLLQPNIEPQERVRRLLNDILFAAFEHETMWQHEERVDSDHSDATVRIKVEATARGMKFVDAVRDPKTFKFSPARVGERRPQTQALLGIVVNSEHHAKFIYRAGSAVAHTALHSFDQRLVLSGERLRRASIAPLNADQVLQDCTLAVQVFVSYLSTLMYQSGWPDSDVLVALDRTEAVWQRIAAVSSTGIEG